MRKARVAKMGKKARWVLPAVCAAALAVGSTGVASAYYTAHETVTNTIRTAEMLEVKLTDEAWEALEDLNTNGVPDAAESMLPGQVLPKAPVVKNISGTSAWAYIVVTVPTANVATIGDAGEYVEPHVAELFTIDADLDGWELLASEEGTDTITHVYAYKAELAVGEETTPLCSAITFVTSADQSEVSGASYKLSFEGSAIQAAGFDCPEDAWSAYVAQTRLASGGSNG